MGLRLGTVSVSAVKLGSSTVSKMYLGTTEVAFGGAPIDASYASTRVLLHLNNSLANTAALGASNPAQIVDLGQSAVAFNSAAAKFGSHGLRFTGTPTGTVGAGDQAFGRLVVSVPSGETQSSGSLPAAWTLEMWVKPSVLWDAGRKQLAAGGDRYQKFWDLFMNGTSLSFTASWFDAASLDTATVSVSGEVSGGLSAAWHYIAVTRDGTAVKLYLNGAQLGSTGTIASGGDVNPAGALNVAANMVFGASYDVASGNWLYGSAMDVDEIRVTNVARTISATPSAAFPES